MLRNKMLLNGLYWLEADQCVRTLAVSYPLWSGDLTSDTLALAKQNAYDQKERIETTLGYVFFSEEDGCLPLHELMNTHPDWDTSKLIIINRLSAKGTDEVMKRVLPFATKYDIKLVGNYLPAVMTEQPSSLS